jgi:eukaryotic-like serine/threonine-protein kinase
LTTHFAHAMLLLHTTKQQRRAMSLDPEARSQQLTLLATHRRTLAHLVAQAAQYGGEVFAPPSTANGIAEARANIGRIKAILRKNGVQVEDAPNDKAPPQVEPIQRAGGDVGMGDKRTINTGGDYAEGDIDKRQGEAFVEHSTVYRNVIGQQTNYYQTIAAPLDRQQQRNRKAMLQKVKTVWIDGLLEQSLAKELRIALDLTTQPDAVNLPLNALVQELNQPAHPLPAGTPIIKVFEQMGGGLLILGAPGAGKTTLLLELARDLIERAEQDDEHPIPVVFNLSSWAEKQRPLKEWLVEELNTKYDVPRKLAQEWMDAEAVLLLLDGLDEVAAEQRGECVSAINTYREEHGLVPLAVCSRVADYEALTSKLRLQGAIVVQPLTKQQVDVYLERAGGKLAGVRAALRDDAELGEMLGTPLMLSIVALAYKDKPLAELQGWGAPNERQRHLFDAYIAVMFKRRSKETHYTQQQTTPWLSWLAHQMALQGQTIFLIERLQPEWLPSRAALRWYSVLDRGSTVLVVGLVYALIYALVGVLLSGLAGGVGGGLVFGLVFGLGASLFGGRSDIDTLQQRSIARVVLDALQGGLGFGLAVGLGFGLAFGLVVGLVVGLVGGLGGGLGGVLTGSPGLHSRRVIIIERLHWSWRTALQAMMSGLVYGLVYGMVVGLVYGLGVGLVVGLMVGLVVGLGGGLVGGLRSGPISAAMDPNQGIGRSAQSALVGGLGCGLGCGLAVGLVYWLVGELIGGLGGGQVYALVVGLVVGLGGGLCGGFAFGGYACQSHFILRLVLSHNNSLPLRLVPFLDYATERIFLRRVGGGYIFIHRLLMEHFASLYTEQPPANPWRRNEGPLDSKFPSWDASPTP